MEADAERATADSIRAAADNERLIADDVRHTTDVIRADADTARTVSDGERVVSDETRIVLDAQHLELSLKRQQDLIYKLRWVRKLKFIVAFQLVVIVTLFIGGIVLVDTVRDLHEVADQACESQQKGREANRRSQFNTSLAAGEAIIEISSQTSETPVSILDAYRSLLVSKVQDQLNIDLPPIACTDDGPVELPPDTLFITPSTLAG